MRVLFTSPILEYPPAGGPALRILNSIKALHRISALYVVSRAGRDQLGGDEAVDGVRARCRRFAFAPSAADSAGRPAALPARALDIARRGARKVLRAAGVAPRSTDPLTADARYLVSYARRHRCRVIWFGYGNISHRLMLAVRQLAPGLKLVCDTDSVWSRFILRELPFEGDPVRRREIESTGRQKEEEERAWASFCDAICAVSAVDADYYRSLGGEPAKVHVFPNAVDLDDYRDAPAPPAGFARPAICLAGTYLHPHSPMDRAARWLLEDVLPLVRASVPAVHLYLIGRGSDRMWSHAAGPHVTVTGKVPSVLPYLRNADVALVPLMFESGTRFKILEAGACRVSVVSTTLGAEGLTVRDGEHLLIADTAEEFAAAILRLLRDDALRRALADRLRALVEASYSLAALGRAGEQILEAVHAGMSARDEPRAGR